MKLFDIAHLKEKLIMITIIVSLVSLIGFIVVSLLLYDVDNCDYCTRICEEKYKLNIDDSLTGCKSMCEDEFGAKNCGIKPQSIIRN